MTQLTASDYKEIENFAKALDVPLAAFLAFMEVETGMNKGEMVGGRLRPLIRWEGHYFDRLIKPSLQALARTLKLASPKVGGIKNPASQSARYEMLERGKKLDAEAAISSCSWGVGQVMGAHWRTLGLASAKEFEQKVSNGFSGQLLIMGMFMQKSGVIPHLRRLDWSAVARIWNGSGYAKNRYDVKMKEAYERHAGEKAPVPKSAGMLRPGSTGAKVRELQGLLVRAGYSLKIDGDYGTSTEKAVRSYQSKNKLEIDGVVGGETMASLQRFKNSPEEKVGVEKPLETPEVKQGLWSMAGGATAIGAARTQLQEAQVELSKYAGTAFVDQVISYLGVGMAVVTVAGLGYAAYGLWKRKKSNLGIEEKMA